MQVVRAPLNVAYHRFRDDMVLSDNILPWKHYKPAYEARRRAEPKCDLNSLGKLPLELFFKILGDLDLDSLFSFAAASREAFFIVEALPAIKAIRKAAPNILRAFLAVQTSRWYSCQDVYRALRAWKCRSCFQFGEFLDVLLCTRLCLPCLDSNQAECRRHHHGPLDKVMVTTLLNDGFLNKFRVLDMESWPGIYGRQGRTRYSSITLLDHVSFSAALGPAKLALMRWEHGQYFKTTQALWRVRFGHREEANWTPCLMEVLAGPSMGYMALARAPFINERSEVERGWNCRGCKEDGSKNDDRSSHAAGMDPCNVFITQTFQKHLEEYGKIRRDEATGRYYHVTEGTTAATFKPAT